MKQGGIWWQLDQIIKNVLEIKKYDYDKLQTHKLELARKNNAKLYWKMLKGSVVCNSSSLASDDFVSYFKSVNDPDSVFFSTR